MSATSGAVVLLRADASNARGIGHAMRTLALGQACVDGRVGVRLLSHDLPDGIRRRFVDSGIPVTALQSSADDPLHSDELLAHRNPETRWIVLDGYDLREPLRIQLASSGLRVAVVDDIGDEDHYTADVLINQNLHARPSMYHRATSTRLLLGPRYAMLRNEFVTVDNRSRQTREKIGRVLISLGGSDPLNLTVPALRALDRALPTAHFTVLVGVANPNRDSIAAHAGASTEVLVDSHEVIRHMRDADAAILAAGSTVWEAAFMGLPMVLLVTADNQEEVAASLAQEGAAISVGRVEKAEQELTGAVLTLVPAERRTSLSAVAQRLVDGAGSLRVLRTLVP